MTPQTIIEEHNVKCKQWKIDLTDTNKCLPYMYWLPKMHKKPSKQRFIAASVCCSTKELSSTLTKTFKLIDKYHAHAAPCHEKNHLRPYSHYHTHGTKLKSKKQTLKTKIKNQPHGSKVRQI